MMATCTFRVDDALKAAFNSAAKNLDRTGAQLRAFVQKELGHYSQQQ